MLRQPESMSESGPLSHKPRILVLVGYYLPGHRGGGPTRSIVNLVEALGDEFEFRIVAFDHDLGATAPYPDVQAGVWTPVGKAHVWYLPSGFHGIFGMVRILRKTPADVIYLNSFFAPLFSLLPVVTTLIGRRGAPVVVAPRGEFSKGALKFKAAKKAAFLDFVRRAGWYRRDRIIFQSSTGAEADDIRRELTGHVKTFIAKPLSPGESPATPFPQIVTAQDLAAAEPVARERVKRKAQGTLSVAWLSRIVPKKNLDGALDLVAQLSGDVRFTVYGPEEDGEYWADCQRQMSGLPANVRARYGGTLKHGDVVRTLEKHDVLLFPTHGENYGHVIVEGLTAGCPVIISDQTPWRGLLNAGVGWDISLDQPSAFVGALQTCVDMDPDAFEAFSRRARSYAASHRDDQTPVEQHRRLFRSALSLRNQTNGESQTEAA
jgi:glycosyltransferase involved in cell wall biosynthesis